MYHKRQPPLSHMAELAKLYRTNEFNVNLKIINPVTLCTYHTVSNTVPCRPYTSQTYQANICIKLS